MYLFLLVSSSCLLWGLVISETFCFTNDLLGDPRADFCGANVSVAWTILEFVLLGVLNCGSRTSMIVLGSVSVTREASDDGLLESISELTEHAQSSIGSEHKNGSVEKK